MLPLGSLTSNLSLSSSLVTCRLLTGLGIMNIVIGSRGSQLALWQANWVKDRLTAAGHEVTIEIIRTSGDKLQSFPPAGPLPASIAQIVAEVGTKGLFIKEIEEALLSGKVDLAVHSLKDLPTVLPDGLILAAVPPREDARDVFISAGAISLEQLPSGAPWVPAALAGRRSSVGSVQTWNWSPCAAT